MTTSRRCSHPSGISSGGIPTAVHTTYLAVSIDNIQNTSISLSNVQRAAVSREGGSLDDCVAVIRNRIRKRIVCSFSLTLSEHRQEGQRQQEPDTTKGIGQHYLGKYLFSELRCGQA